LNLKIKTTNCCGLFFSRIFSFNTISSSPLLLRSNETKLNVNNRSNKSVIEQKWSFEYKNQKYTVEIRLYFNPERKSHKKQSNKNYFVTFCGRMFILEMLDWHLSYEGDKLIASVGRRNGIVE